MENIHTKIIDLLRRLVSPGIASYYIDAWELLTGDYQLSSTNHLIAHLFREIESAIRDVASQIDPNTLQEIAANRTSKKKNDSHHESEVTILLSWLGFSEQDETWETWVRMTRKDPWKLEGQAHRRSLRTPRELSDEARARWLIVQKALCNILRRLELKFTSVLKRVIEMATRKPKEEDKKYLEKYFPRTFVTTREFLGNIESPEWLKPLEKLHFFDDPPRAQIDPDGTPYMPPWPAAEFLKKMAPQEDGIQGSSNRCFNNQKSACFRERLCILGSTRSTDKCTARAGGKGGRRSLCLAQGRRACAIQRTLGGLYSTYRQD